MKNSYRNAECTHLKDGKKCVVLMNWAGALSCMCGRVFNTFCVGMFHTMSENVNFSNYVCSLIEWWLKLRNFPSHKKSMFHNRIVLSLNDRIIQSQANTSFTTFLTLIRTFDSLKYKFIHEKLVTLLNR